MKQGRNPGQVVFGGVGNQAEDKEAVDDVDVVTVGDREPSQGESQPSQPLQSQPSQGQPSQGQSLQGQPSRGQAQTES